MTNPTTPAAPAAAPDDLSARDFFQQDDAALSKALGLAPKEEEAPVEPVEEEIIPAEGEEIGPPARRESVPTDAEGAETGAEEGETEVELPKAERKLMTEFKLLDEKGELEIPDIEVEFKAKGEVRKLPLDHVVRLAQFGFANEEREQQVQAAKHFVAEAQQKEEQFTQAIQQYEGYYDRIFNDPAFYEEARLAYLNQHTPEARAQRAEQQLHAVKTQQLEAQEQQYLAGFVTQTLTPAVSRLMSENPLVSEQEVIGRYTQLTAPLLKNGRVPLNRLAEVKNLVESDLATWVQQTQYERDLTKRQRDQQAAQATRKVAEAKRQTGRIFAQPGRVPESQPKPTKFDSARDWLNATLPTPSE